jgi:Tol biopolymer transport system component
MLAKSSLFVLFGAFLTASSSAQTTARASVDSNGLQVADGSWWSSISSDGNRICFESSSPNLVPGDTNGWADIFVHDFQSGQTTRVSVTTSGAQANQDCLYPVISHDGNSVAFVSRGSFDPLDTNLQEDIIVHDSLTGQTTRVSVDSNGANANNYSTEPTLSSDGRFVAFTSYASNLVPSDTNATFDVFVHDLLTGTTTRANVSSSGAQANGVSWQPSISGDGRYVAFESFASNLVAGDTNATSDIFVHDMTTGATTRVSLGLGGAQAGDGSLSPVFSADGRRIAFWSYATNLVPNDTNGLTDLFVVDLATGETRQVNVDSAGLPANDGLPWQYSYDPPALSDDGRFIAFHSGATNLVPGDTNFKVDVFVHDMLGGGTTRASAGAGGQQATDVSVQPGISGDGRYVSFESLATNLVSGDTNNRSDIFRRDRLGSAASVAYCAGDGFAGSCPCSNSGLAWHGCENSATTGGALLLDSGSTSPDTLVFKASAELPTALSIFLQGNAELNPAVVFGDGLRCVGGSLKRLYAKSAVGGEVSAPGPGDNPVSIQSALLGDPIAPGSTRSYQVYYRDPNASFCAAPSGNTWNVGNALRVYW